MKPIFPHRNTTLFQRFRGKGESKKGVSSVTAVSAGTLASVLVIVSAMIFAYTKIWAHRIGFQSSHDPSLNMLVEISLGIVALCSLLKFAISFHDIMDIGVVNIAIYVMLLCVAFLFYKTKSIGTDFILAGLIGFVLHKEKPRLIIESTFYSCLVLFSFQLLGYALGLFHDNGVWTSAAQPSAPRLAFGFGYPTYVFAYFLPILMGIYYLDKIKFRKITAAYCLALLVIVFLKTASKALLILTALMLFNPIVKVGLKKSRLVRQLMVLAYPLFALLSICSAIFMSRIPPPIRDLFSGRFWYWNQYWKGGVRIWGPTPSNNDLFFVQRYPLDNAILHALFIGGIIVIITIGVMYTKLIYSAIKASDYKLAVLVLNTLEFGFTEALFSLGITVIMPLLYSVFLQRTPASHQNGSTDIALTPRHSTSIYKSVGKPKT